MEERKLTKADIDKVRHIEGFPIAKDEDIIALSRPPYYTACPNPFIEEFIRENGTPYDEATDDYHREPFAADVSEGKNDPIYNAHSYHTKVPHKAIMRYILHYTEPGDIVFDGFCGTGMTGVAAQMCGCPDSMLKAQIESEMPYIAWGTRKAILSDLSPAATFISYNYNTTMSSGAFLDEAKRILRECEAECGWMYSTTHIDSHGDPVIGIDGKPITGRVTHVVWSDIFICPGCSKEIVYWDAAADLSAGMLYDDFKCPYCGASLKKKDCERAFTSYLDGVSSELQKTVKQVPVQVYYTALGKRFIKKPDTDDFSILDRVMNMRVDTETIPFDLWPDGDKTGEPRALGYKRVYQIYSKRNLIWLSCLYSKIQQTGKVELMTLITSVANRNITRCNRFVINKYNPQGRINGPMSGNLYIASLNVEQNPAELITYKADDLAKMYAPPFGSGDSLVTTQSACCVRQIPDNSVDYIFTDPPFGHNINYSELNSINESWLHVKTNIATEAIISRFQRKELQEYQSLMERSFAEYYRVLKPSHWITIEFHNSQNAVWNAIQEGLMRSGFIIADVRTLDKKQTSINQDNARGAVQQDLVISAYKPHESFIREFQQRAGDPEMAWEFVRQHLRNVPVTADGNHDGKLDIIAERQDYLLFDRMVAWHIMNGIPVPMDAHTFYEGLRQRFLERDGMFFLPDQVNEYDDKRAHMELDTAQLSFIVTDEKNAIQWLNYILAQGPMTYQEIQPLYMQELHQSRQEKMPELLDMLKENFVQDDKGAWYVPDLTNAADLAKVRRKALLKEFWDSCATGKGKLKVFRMEAIRAGFDECWKTRDFKTIVAVGERLPEAVLQEDPALLMYYDNACSRV